MRAVLAHLRLRPRQPLGRFFVLEHHRARARLIGWQEARIDECG